MKTRLLVLACSLVMLTWHGASAQEALSLDSCVQRAYDHFALQRQQQITAEATQANLDRIGKTYLHTLDPNAVSTYQNEQIEIPIGVNIPGFTPPSAPLNLNSALFTVRQWIWDGSASFHQRLIEEASGKADQLEIEVRRLEIKTGVMQQYFAVLLADRQREILSEQRNVLAERQTEVRSAVDNHLLLQSDADLLAAEIAQLDQAITEVAFTRRQYVRGLGQLMGSPLPDEVSLQEPQAQQTTVVDLGGRPEMQLFDSRMNELEARKGAIGSRYLPRIGVFADVGVGLPGYNIFADDPALMGRAGLTLNWHIFDWGQGGLQEQTIDLNRQLLHLQKQQLATQLTVQAEAQRTAVEKAEALMKTDAELVRLYTSVSDAYASQLENGTITSADYIAQLNKQQVAQTNLELHRLQRIIATLNYNTMLGQ